MKIPNSVFMGLQYTVKDMLVFASETEDIKIKQLCIEKIAEKLGFDLNKLDELDKKPDYVSQEITKNI